MTQKPLPPSTLHLEELKTLEYPEEIDENSSLEDHKRVAAKHLNNALKATYAGWGKVDTIGGIRMLASLTADLVTKQRELLLQPKNYSEYLSAKQPKKSFGFENIE